MGEGYLIASMKKTMKKNIVQRISRQLNMKKNAHINYSSGQGKWSNIKLDKGIEKMLKKTRSRRPGSHAPGPGAH